MYEDNSKEEEDSIECEFVHDDDFEGNKESVGDNIIDLDGDEENMARAFEQIHDLELANHDDINLAAKWRTNHPLRKSRHHQQ